VGINTRRPGAPAGPLAEVLALVDSGADRSAFPLQIAKDLGIADNELVEEPAGGAGVGSTFRVWTTTVPIMAGIGFFQPAPDGTVQPWGPGFSLNPSFVEADAFLLGRADFFQAFTVTFDMNGAGQTVFHLDTRP
jgi:hypothetical protein